MELEEIEVAFLHSCLSETGFFSKACPMYEECFDATCHLCLFLGSSLIILYGNIDEFALRCVVAHHDR